MPLWLVAVLFVLAGVGLFYASDRVVEALI